MTVASSNGWSLTLSDDFHLVTPSRDSNENGSNKFPHRHIHVQDMNNPCDMSVRSLSHVHSRFRTPESIVARKTLSPSPDQRSH